MKRLDFFPLNNNMRVSQRPVASLPSCAEWGSIPPTRSILDMKLLQYALIRTTRRLTFDILWQDESTIYMGDDDGEYFSFTASNGYQVISRSRMDIQTERLWLLGAKHKEEARSGTMVFSSDSKAKKAHIEFIKAIDEWAAHHGGTAERIF